MPFPHQPVLDWLSKNHAHLVGDLAKLVAIPSISTDGEHQKEIDQTAALTCEQMRRAGLQNVEILRTGGSNPYAYGEWLGAPGKPTVFLYAHHDVQPINFVERLAVAAVDADAARRPAVRPRLRRRQGRHHRPARRHRRLPQDARPAAGQRQDARRGRGGGRLREPARLLSRSSKKRIQSDVIVVCDTENIETGLPSITYSLRGIVAVLVEVQSGQMPVHSGMAGGVLADAALALNVILSRLYWKNGKLPIPGFYDRVRPLNAPSDASRWPHCPATKRSGGTNSASCRACTSPRKKASTPTSRPGASRR